MSDVNMSRATAKVYSLTGSCVLCGAPRGGDDVVGTLELSARRAKALGLAATTPFLICRRCFIEPDSEQRAREAAKLALRNGALAPETAMGLDG